ncbi:MAG: nitrate- and nitrite sensing domain-containing protein [Micromonosporaceae bacterium]|nr:nitrate- and nitrite sensing domain-containing protein [Micromonosporaceae bacterium]
MREPDAVGDHPTEAIRPRLDPRDAAPPHLALTSTWSIRSKLVAVLAVPVVAMVVLWVVATWVTLAPGLALLDARDSVDAVGRPAQTLIAALQEERKLAVGYLASKDRASEEYGADALAEQYQRTDQAVAEFRASANTSRARSALTSAGAVRLDEFLLHVSTLPSVRGAVEDGSIERSGALLRYTEMVEAGLALVRSLVRPSTEDLQREAHALVDLAEARELLARQDAVLTGATESGAFTSVDVSQIVQLIGARRHQVALALVDLHPADRDAYEDLADREPAAVLTALEDRLVIEARVGQPVPIDAATWRDAYDQVTADLREFELAAADRLVERSQPQAVFIIVRIVVTGAIGVIALVMTAIGSLRVARSVLRRLAGLRQAALELAIDRIPGVVARLRAGERVDVEAEAPPLPYGADEIGQVGRAFNALQREAVGAAVAEADLRRGVNEVFLNIARRSQTLLHRQLAILDAMERRTEDPVELEDLFRVDHLATRMRRHAEDLVILAGAAPARGWRLPVPLVDVLRGAVSEVEDYARVTVRPVPDVAVTGRAVGDVIHLLAELIENATAFSPPSTKVTVGAEPVTHGVAVEIEDRGIGIPPATLEQLNARLTDPPAFAEFASRRADTGSPSSGAELSDPGAGGQLGLFVVARLASRHGIQVQLRRSAYGGTTAVVLLPTALLARPGEQPALPAGASDGSPASTRRAERSAAAIEATPVGLVPLSSASPTAPRSAAGFTPVPAQGGPLPSRRPQADRAAGAGPADDRPSGDVIVATTGQPLGRHTRRDVIDPEGPDDLPRRIRRRDAPRHTAEPDDFGRTWPATENPTATQPDGARSPEQIRAMMSSFQAGLARGREAAEAGAPGRANDAPGAGDRTATDSGVPAAESVGGDQPARATAPGGLDGGEQSGAQASDAGDGDRAG